MIGFWILAPIMVLAAVSMLFVRKAVHSALLLAVVMISLAVLYAIQDAPFLFAVQIIVYTGAILMLFLFVLMLVGVDASDSIVETIKGQRVFAIAVGLVGRLKLPQYPDREFPAKIVTTANAIAPNSRTLLVQFQADNPDGALLPGSYAQMRIDLPPEGAPLSLPASALVFVNAAPQVATVDARGIVRMKPVAIARDLGVTLEISSGLATTDRVIKTPWQSIHDGLEVKIKGKTREADAR